ncbi:hypothetical protein [Bradyrhizobium sp.]|uniref:hypothetical protein n=1 Tax=Bradyrhizobium sp. TaxID=376 RepID=UPI0026268414|nr:hypothetical protein [Bradyrhizobium sp.]
MGIAASSLLESTARVTIRQSDREAMASEVATASLGRVDAMAIAEPLKPAGLKNRIMDE